MKQSSGLRLILGVAIAIALAFSMFGGTMVWQEPAPAEATHFRAAQINWVPLGGNTIQFTIEDAFRRNGYRCYNLTTLATKPCSGSDGLPAAGDVFLEYIGATRFNFGDGSGIGSPLGPLMYVVTSADLANNWVFARALNPSSFPSINDKITHAYAAVGNYTAFIYSCCRVSALLLPNAHINNPDGNYRVESRVNVGVANSSPESSLPPIVACPINTICSFQILGSDPDGDQLRFRLSTSLEASGSSTGFTQPGPPHAPNAATVSSAGIYTWNTTGATLGPSGYQTLYSTQVTIEDLDGSGNPKSKTALDFFIQLVPDIGVPPVFNNPPTAPSCGSTLNVSVGATLSFTIQSSDPDPGQLVTLNVAGLPLGATMTPALPLTGNPISSTFSWTPTAADVGTTVVAFSATDNSSQQSGKQTLCSITVVASSNQRPTANAGPDVSGKEGSPIALAGSAADPDNDPLTYQWSYAAGADVDAGATCSFADASAASTTITCTDDGTYTATLTASDGKGGTHSDSAIVTVANVNPALTITAPAEGALYTLGTITTITGSFTDAGTNDTHTCAINWDEPAATTTTEAGAVTETGGAGTCSKSHTYAAAGVYTIQVTVADDDGGATTQSVMVVVYDPSAGFVTGGGWIDSTAGAYTADPTLTGRAIFGFVSKYQKGAKTPTGQTEFQFQAGSLNFHSTSYEWLVVSGAKAQYKGTGTVNGENGYDFLLTVTDGQVNGGGGVDRFRIRITKAGGVVYDNVPGGSLDMDSANPQAISFGSIVIHSGK